MKKLYFTYAKFLPYLIIVLFILAYTILSFVRHTHYQSFGYDLGINDQAVWKYAHFQLPITTIGPFPDRTKFTEHIEIVYALIAPFYWIWDSPYMLLFLQIIFFCSSAVAVFLIAQKHKVVKFVSLCIVIAYLMFFGVQFGLWTDVHSSIFAAAFLMWFIYSLDTKKIKMGILFFLLTLTAKESTGSTLFCVSLIYFIYRKEKIHMFYMVSSVLYLLFVFFIFYPQVMHIQYLYANHKGILSNINPASLIDSSEKRNTIFYTFASWGFLPLLTPLWLIPILNHFYKFFVVASDLSGAESIFGQYRIMLTPIFATATIVVIKRYKNPLQIFFGIWLLISAMLMQYILHLPLSYLAKSWFWKQPSGVKNINEMILKNLPSNASVVAQNNIVPHISHRNQVYSLYPEIKLFTRDSPCGKTDCNWFRWYGNPQYLLVDTSPDWDARHLLADRKKFLDGIKNLEHAGVIKKYKEIGTTVLYKSVINPDNFK